jgi:hypothetical protein
VSVGPKEGEKDGQGGRTSHERGPICQHEGVGRGDHQVRWGGDGGAIGGAHLIYEGPTQGLMKVIKV